MRTGISAFNPVDDGGWIQCHTAKKSVVLLGNHAAIGATFTGVDLGLKHLYHLRSLEYLDLAGTYVTSEGVAELRKHLPNTEVRWQYEFNFEGDPCVKPKLPRVSS